jgi:hypothetical protein
MSNQNVAFIKSGSGSFTIFMNNQAYNVGVNHPNYQAISDALKQKKYDNLVNLVDIPKTIEKKFAATQSNDSQVEVRDGTVYYGGQAVHNCVASKILEFLREGFSFEPLTAFLKNLMENPSFKSVERLYAFLEKNNHPITEDGFFLAYKRVRDDYLDFYSGTFDNTPGQTCKMLRNKVEDDPNKTCSNGLHVANLDYAQNHYHSGQGKLVVCKVNPKDVVSVPTDYNESKMRVSEYVVLADYAGVPVTQKDYVQVDKPLSYDNQGWGYDPDDDEDDDDNDSWDDEDDDA